MVYVVAWPELPLRIILLKPKYCTGNGASPWLQNIWATKVQNSGPKLSWHVTVEKRMEIRKEKPPESIRIMIFTILSIYIKYEKNRFLSCISKLKATLAQKCSVRHCTIMMLEEQHVNHYKNETTIYLLWLINGKIFRTILQYLFRC